MKWIFDFAGNSFFVFCIEFFVIAFSILGFAALLEWLFFSRKKIKNN